MPCSVYALLGICLARYMPCFSQLPLIFFYEATVHVGPKTPPHSHTKTPPHPLSHSRCLLSTCDQPSTEVAACTTHNKDNIRTSMLSAGFEPVILAIKRLQTYVLDRAATGFGCVFNYQCLVYTVPYGVHNYQCLVYTVPYGVHNYQCLVYTVPYGVHNYAKVMFFLNYVILPIIGIEGVTL
jgi:hypothetical protein